MTLEEVLKDLDRRKAAGETPALVFKDLKDLSEYELQQVLDAWWAWVDEVNRAST